MEKIGGFPYNPWPIGQVPPELRRPEIEQLKEKGYEIQDARDAIGLFEKKVAEFTGAPYAVAVDCCTHALELCLEYLGASGSVLIPNRTYISVPMTLRKMGFDVRYDFIQWSGAYQISPFKIWDAAVRWKRNMYIPDSFMCLSFQIKKAIPIGRGGMILTDDERAARTLKLMSYDGRDLTTPYDSPCHVVCMGHHYYMTPEDAARGILLMDSVEERGDYMDFSDYPRVDKMMRI